MIIDQSRTVEVTLSGEELTALGQAVTILLAAHDGDDDMVQSLLGSITYAVPLLEKLGMRLAVIHAGLYPELKQNAEMREIIRRMHQEMRASMAREN